MNKIFDLIIAQRRATYAFFLLIAIGGVFAFTRLGRDVYPELNFPRIVVIASAGDISPERLLVSVTQHIEDAASHVYKVRWIRSKTIRGGTEVYVEFEPGTDMDFAMQQLESRLAEIRNQLPPESMLIVEPVTPAIFPVINYNLWSKTLTLADLYTIARYQIEPLLSQVKGVARVTVQGGDVPEISIEVNPQKVYSYGLSVSQLANAINQSNRIHVVGRLDERYQQNLVVTSDEALNLADFRQIVVKNNLNGSPVFLKDVAAVKEGHADRLRLVSVHGRAGMVLNVFRQPNSNILDVSQGVAKKLAEIRNSLPPDFRLDRAYDESRLVREAIASILEAIVIGVGLIVVVLLFFLRSWRATLLAALTIPLSALSAFAIMALMGQSFNLMSLGGIAIAIGLVIDDAIVVIENIHMQLSKGMDSLSAARQALHELVAPITSSTITTVVVFVPLGLLSGVAGQFFTALTVTLASAVLFSLVLSLTLTPLMAAQWLKKEQRHATEDGITTRWQQAYGSFLSRVLRQPTIVILLSAVILAVSLLMFNRLGTDFLPKLDEGSYVLDYLLPPGTSLEQTDKVCKQIEEVLRETPEVETWTRRTGVELGLFATEPNTGDILVVLKSSGKERAQRSSEEVMDEQRKKLEALLPGIELEFHPMLEDQLNDMAGVANPVEVRIFGEDPKSLAELAETVKARLEKVKGLVDIAVSSQAGAPELHIRPDPYKCARLDLTPAAIADQVKIALLGTPATKMKRGDKLIDVRIRLSDTTRFDPTKLKEIPIVGKNGSILPLAAVAAIERVQGEREIHRENRQRYISVDANIEGRDLGAVVADIKKELAAVIVPSGLFITIAGLYQSQQESFTQLFWVLLLGAMLVYVVMVAQFRSLKQPLAIFTAVPLSLLGVECALLYTNTPLNISSFMGLILLVGLIVKNGIILLEYSNRLQREGVHPDQAIVTAGVLRLRPILMTTLCTLFGLIPLALGLGTGAEIQKPLAITVIGGLSVSTIITLIVVPVINRLLRPGTEEQDHPKVNEIHENKGASCEL